MMRNFVNTTWSRMALFATALFSAGVVDVSAQETSIENIARVEWDAGARRVSIPSNRVALSVERPAPVQPTLVTYQLNNQPGALQANVSGSVCKGSNGPQTITLGGIFDDVDINAVKIEATTKIHAGEPLVIGLTSTENNRDPNAVDRFDVKLNTPSGDSEVITLVESAANSSVFFGMIQTAAIPPTPVAGDCRLSVHPGETLQLSGLNANNDTLIATSPMEVLIDPFGVVFDSADGKPVQGVRVTLIDTATGQPAQVFGDDGVSAYPSSVLTGSTVTDASGTVYTFTEGLYRFPFARRGQYRLLVEPPAPYSAPSAVPPAELAGLRRPDGPPFTLGDASYGAPFILNDPAPVRIDIPVDKPGVPLVLRKTAAREVAEPGDGILYRLTVTNGDRTRSTGAITITDNIPAEMRLRTSSVRLNGIKLSNWVINDTNTLTVRIPALSGGASSVVSYLLEVRPDAKPGRTLNRAQARDSRGNESPIAEALVRITREAIADRVTIIGRVTEGGCTVDPRAAKGIPGVRVMLEDGSYAVTDEDGRYHFDGVKKGLHVVQMDPSTMPANQIPVDCVRNARSGGSAISRFVEGRGGMLVRVDFRAVEGENKARLEGEQAKRNAPVAASDASGASRDWLAGQTPGVDWLFPETDYNPRAKSTRVAIKHLPNQTVRLMVDGKVVDPVTFDGTRTSADGQVAVSLWRGIDLNLRDTLLTAEILHDSGNVVQKLVRNVHFSSSPMNAVLVREKSVLVADGVTRPVIALKMTDRDGRPSRDGMTGDFTVPAPYYAAVAADAQAARGLAGLERGRPVWHIEGDDGIAYIELEPTTASGTLTVTLPLRDGETSRLMRVETWLDPGKRPWTVVGFAAGTAGFNTLDSNNERLAERDTHWYTDARLALYAKGRIKGKWLMTLAYDSDKDKDDTRFQGTIDPNAYYTVYADRTERRHDAASVRRLYLRLERPQFYALFGDYDTGIVEPQLSRYSRAFNGVKAEYKSEKVGLTAFAADTPFRHRRQELQGNGLTGPYALGARDILANSERVVLEVRDRLRSNLVISSRALVRHIDYDIDYVAGTLRFREPILSRNSQLDPQFIVVDYELDGVAQRVVNAGGRATWTNEAKTLTVGATAIHDADDTRETNQGGVDVKVRPNASTEVRAEFAVSDGKSKTAATASDTGTNTAWLVEAEHHGSKFDVLAYAREQQAGFGVGQTNFGEGGTRKIGVDGRVRLGDKFSVTGSAWNEDYLGSAQRRQAGQLLGEYRSRNLDLRAGITHANDRLEDGRTGSSTIAQLGAAKRFFGGALEFDAQTEMAIADKDESIDFPARHKLGARYKISDDVSLVGSYEIAKSDVIDARTIRVGFDVEPWNGARFTGSMGQQTNDDYSPRTFAAYGLSQSVPINEKWTVDYSFDGAKTLGGFDPTRVLNEDQPIASGGFIGSDRLLAEDFNAATLGATYRGGRWSWTGRAEVRDSNRDKRYGITTAALREIGQGRAFGAGLNWFRAKSVDGVATEAASLQLSWAHRPDSSRFAFLDKLELRMDKISGATAGLPGPIGGAPVNIQGNAASKRIINSFSLNYSPTREREGEFLDRTEFGLFWGARYVFDKYGEDKVAGLSNVFGADIRFDLGKHVDVGFSGTVRQNPKGRAISYSGGPAVSFSPIENSYITVGYNVIGFEDRDFEQNRYTRAGPFVTLRLKFDQNSFAGLGIGR